MPSPPISVMPQSSTSGQPARDSHSSILATGMVCPPTVQRVSEDKSYLSNSGCASMYMYMVGTPSNMVALCSWIAARVSTSVKPGSSTSVMP